MENKIVEKIESIVGGIIKEFSKHPIGTTIKGLIIFWIAKKVFGWIKND